MTRIRRFLLARSKFAKPLETRGLDYREVFDGFAALAAIVVPASIAPVIGSDPPDDLVLATALAAQADLIVSGDSNLLNQKPYQDIPIVTAAEALARIAQR